MAKDCAGSVSVPVTDKFRKTLDSLDKHRHHIEAALTHADWTHTFDDVVMMVLRGEADLWDLGDSILITELVDFPQQRHYSVFLGGGSLDTILAAHPMIEAAARSAGCSKLSVTGRLGWIKALSKHGWELKHATCTKEL